MVQEEEEEVQEGCRWRRWAAGGAGVRQVVLWGGGGGVRAVLPCSTCR